MEELAAIEAAKKAKKLLPPKQKEKRQEGEESKEEADGKLVVNMDYVKMKARRQFKS